MSKLCPPKVKANCTSTVTHTLQGGSGVAVRIRAQTLQVSSQDGVSLSCDLTQALCSFSLDGLLHGQRKKNIELNLFCCHCLLTCLLVLFCTGASVGLLGTNDNEAGNDSPLPDGSQAQSLESFLNGWQVGQVRVVLTTHCPHTLQKC